MGRISEDLVAFIVIVNPFALSLYLTGVMDDLSTGDFYRVLAWASFLSLGIFVVFASFGEWIIIDFLAVDPDALRIFGGLIIAVVAYGYVIRGYKSLELLRGSLEELPSAIAVPFMVGAGSLTKSILLGRNHALLTSWVIIFAGVVLSFVVVLLFKTLRDHIRKAYEKVFDRYVSMLSRMNGLLLGAVSMDMIVTGIRDVWSG